MRENTKEFDYVNGGLSLNRDGFHLTLDYGRYAAALTWACNFLPLKRHTPSKKDHIYQAAMLDPHTSSELDIDTIKKW